LLRAVAAAPVASGHSHARRDDLRARATLQLAVAREMRAEYAAVSQEIHTQLALRHARRRN
jgi:hypothetical protein